MWTTTFATLRGNKRRVLSTSWAVILGVAFLAGTFVIGDTMRGGFSDLFNEANANTDALVRSSTGIETEGVSQVGLLDGSLVDDIAALDGVATAVPLVERAGMIVGADGDPIGGQGPPTVAGNWITDPAHNPYDRVDGRAPRAGDEVVIDQGSADVGDLSVGDSTFVRLPQPVEVTVVGIAAFGAADSAGGSTFAGFTLDAAQDLLLPDPGQLTGVVVAADEGITQGELVRRLQPVLTGDIEAITGEALTAEQNEQIQSDFLGFVENLLLVFAGIALIVACFSIYNTFSIVVAQRTRESALLRALGASRRQVLVSIVAEAVVVGLVASGLGVLAGLGLARGLDALMDAAGLGLPGSSLLVQRDSIVVSLVVGLVVTVLSSVVPAVKASRVLPLAALRDVAVDRSAASRWRLAAGAVVSSAGIAMAVSGATVAGGFPLTGGGALAVLVGLLLLGPVAARPASRVLGTPGAVLRGMSGRLAQRNSVRNPKRTANTASALMVGVAVVAMFTVVAASLRSYVETTTNETFAADLVIISDSFSGVSLSPSLGDEVAALPEVEVAATLGNAPLQVDGEDEWATSADGPDLERVFDPGKLDGDISGLAAGTVLLSEPFAMRTPGSWAARCRCPTPTAPPRPCGSRRCTRATT